jgi:hypothetical protein
MRRALRATAILLAVLAAGGSVGCGGSDEEDESPQTTSTTALGGGEIEFPELQQIRDCIVDAGFPEPLVGERPAGDDDAADAELIFDAGNNQPVFIVYYESAERAQELASNVEREAKRLRGEYVLEDNVGVLYVRTPADVREQVEGCVRS